MEANDIPACLGRKEVRGEMSPSDGPYPSSMTDLSLTGPGVFAAA